MGRKCRGASVGAQGTKGTTRGLAHGEHEWGPRGSNATEPRTASARCPGVGPVVKKGYSCSSGGCLSWASLGPQEGMPGKHPPCKMRQCPPCRTEGKLVWEKPLRTRPYLEGDGVSFQSRFQPQIPSHHCVVHCAMNHPRAYHRPAGQPTQEKSAGREAQVRVPGPRETALWTGHLRPLPRLCPHCRKGRLWQAISL